METNNLIIPVCRKYGIKNMDAIEENRDCNELCRKLTLQCVLMFGAICLLTFILGYFLKPSQLRLIWLILSGTSAVGSGIVIYLLSYRIFVFEKKSESDN